MQSKEYVIPQFKIIDAFNKYGIAKKTQQKDQTQQSFTFNENFFTKSNLIYNIKEKIKYSFESQFNYQLVDN